MDFDFFIDAAAPFGSTDRTRLRGKLLPQSLDAQGPWTETIQRMYWHVESLRFSASAAHVDGFQSVFFPCFCRGAHPEFHNERFRAWNCYCRCPCWEGEQKIPSPLIMTTSCHEFGNRSDPYGYSLPTFVCCKLRGRGNKPCRNVFAFH